MNPQDTTEALQLLTMHNNSEQVLGTLHYVKFSICWCGFHLSSKLQISHMFRIFFKQAYLCSIWQSYLSHTAASLCQISGGRCRFDATMPFAPRKCNSRIRLVYFRTSIPDV